MQGLHAIAAADRAAHAESPLPALVDALRFEVVRLHEENRRAVALLGAAAELASRSRAFLARLMGAEVVYPALAGAGGRGSGA